MQKQCTNSNTDDGTLAEPETFMLHHPVQEQSSGSYPVQSFNHFDSSRKEEALEKDLRVQRLEQQREKEKHKHYASLVSLANSAGTSQLRLHKDSAGILLEYDDVDQCESPMLQDQSMRKKIRNTIAESIAETLPEVKEKKKELRIQELQQAMKVANLEHQLKITRLTQLLENSRPLQELARENCCGNSESLSSKSVPELIEELYVQRIRHRLIEEEYEHKVKMAQLHVQLTELKNPSSD